MIKFKNIWKGKIIEIDHKEFDKNFLDLSTYANKIFLESSGNKDEFNLINYKESNSNIYSVFEHKKTKAAIRCMITNLKNSGTEGNQDKRVQVNVNINFFKEDEPYFIFGFYNAGDKVIIAIAEISRFVINAMKGQSYSSFWIPFDLITETYSSQRENVLFEKKGAYIINSISFKKLLETYKHNIFEVLVYNEKIKKLLKDLGGNLLNLEQKKEVVKVEPKTPPQQKVIPTIVQVLPKGVSVLSISRLQRDPNLRNRILERANYKCEFCGKNRTFLDNSRKMYFEAHHIIPFHQEAQKDFKFSLDHESNLVCLCPECHRKIHHSSKEDINEMLVNLLLKRKDLIQRYELVSKSKIEGIVNFYLTSEGKEDE